MQIKSLNKLPACYGLPEFIDYKTPGFLGHQVCICIGSKAEDGTIESFIHSKDPESITDAQLFESLLSQAKERQDVLILMDEVTNFVEGNLIKKTMYYVPYYVVDHSAYQPTPNFTSISFSCNVRNKVKYEILFVDENEWGNRYINIETTTSGSMDGGTSLSLLDMIDDLEQDIISIAQDQSDSSIRFENGSLIVKFYDKVGNPYDAEFTSVDHLLRCVTSVRILDVEKEIIKDGE